MFNMCMLIIEDDEDKKQFEELYIKYEKIFYSIAFSILKNHELSEEACSEAFLSIAKHFDFVSKLDSKDLPAYLKVVISNTSKNIYKKEKKYTETAEIIDDFSYFSDEVLSAVNYNFIIECINELSETDGVILWLYFFHGLSGKEIANTLHITYEAVRKRLQTAKNNLKKLLEKEKIL